MPRTHARLLVTLWEDKDWRALNAHDQAVYAALLTTADLSWCGVAPLLPQRLAGWSADLDLRKVQKSLLRLASEEGGRFLVLDEETGEVLVRTYVRHDDFLKQPNVTKAMIRALALVRSGEIRDVVISELGRKLKDEPDLKGWQVIEQANPQLFQRVLDSPSRNAS